MIKSRNAPEGELRDCFFTGNRARSHVYRLLPECDPIDAPGCYDLPPPGIRL